LHRALDAASADDAVEGVGPDRGWVVARAAAGEVHGTAADG